MLKMSKQTANLNIIMVEIVAIQACSFWHSSYALDSLFIHHLLTVRGTFSYAYRQGKHMYGFRAKNIQYRRRQ